MGNLCNTEQDQSSGGSNILQERHEKPPVPLARVLVVPEKKMPLKVYGNYFNSDTRTILTLLDISGITYEFEEVDIFKGEPHEPEYLEKNPLGSIPMLIDADCTLLGNISVFTNYLTLTKPKLASYRPKEHTNKIDQYLQWFMTVLRPCVARLTKVLIGPKCFGQGDFSGD